ncbi:restriction endonuclease [Streptomyces nigrescens]|uniref:restriction endonuclease n=1 Tax=Streptomyces nigrescens TaxID=1920 RepID=UPI0021C48D59|nr:restriction endonuclease [Streptomyces nigrescens]
MVGGICGIISTIFLFVTFQQQERGVKAAEKSGAADQAGEKRAKQEEAERKKRAEGPPIAATPGAPAYYASRFAFPGRTTNLGPAANFKLGTKEYADWFRENKAEEVGVSAYRVTLSPTHEGTTVVQNMRLSNPHCTPTKYTGTAVVPTPIGDGGDSVRPVTVAFDLSAASPQPRQILSNGTPEEGGKEVWRIGGSAFREGIYLNGGDQSDARSFDIYFFAGSKDCTFGLEVNVTSGTKDGWYPVKITTSPDGRGRVAGQAKRYESTVIPNQDAVNELKGPGNPFAPIELKKSKL